MKLVIQLPCYNEADQLPATLAALPRELDGFDCVELLVVDDGSTDSTAEIARAHGVAHIVRLPERRGLGYAFSAGIEASLRAGADVVVNTDGDNQYCAEDIGTLVAPILRDRAHVVVGARPIAEISHFSFGKKLVQRMGSAVVRVLSGVAVPDATSGFRAYAREAALTLNVFSRYTYSIETLIQAGRHRLVVQSVPVRVNPPTRRSRLAQGHVHYVWRAMLSMLMLFIARCDSLGRPQRFSPSRLL
jgi:glycosyltransferase involved in cell wall biosynthesis